MSRFDPESRAVGTAAVAECANRSRTGEAIRRAVELAGGMPWLEPGQSVVIKPALNSSGPFPFTSSPASVAELVRMSLERDAGKVYVADEKGFEHTMLKQWKTGQFTGFEKDLTIAAFKKTGIHDAVMQVADDLGARDRVHITTFREEGWRRHDFEGANAGSPQDGATLHKHWLQRELKGAEKWSGDRARRMYIPRIYDKRIKRATPGFWVPKLLDRADHIINDFRISTHVWSHYTMAIKNWVGIMRPDDRVWMHQLNYLKNHRHEQDGLDDDHPVRTEPLYHEQLADLHLPHAEKERLCVADASEIIVTGGPDDTDRPFCKADLVMAATDVVSADVVSLALLRYGTLEAPDGLLGRCDRQPSGWGEAVGGLIKDLKWPEKEGKNVFKGTDAKLCDPTFSNWDWVAVQRARELGLGIAGPEDLRLIFDEGDSPFAVSSGKRDFISKDALRAPACQLRNHP
jgi:uncharacterized protein (DUF362 family)